jgi:hypothetical protein
MHVDEVTGGWKKLHKEELHNLYSSPSVIRTIKSRRMRWAGHVARIGEKRNAYRLLMGKPERKRPVGKPRRRRVDNINMDLLEIGWGGVDWIGLSQDRDNWGALVNTIMNLQVPQNAGKLSSAYTIGGLLSSSQFHRVSLVMHVCIVATANTTQDNLCSLMLHREFSSENLGGGGGHNIHGSITQDVKERILEVRYWIQLTYDRIKLQVLANIAKPGIFSVTNRLFASEK